MGGIHWGENTPKDFTKPKQTIQNPGILHKAAETLYKAPTDYRNLQKEYTKPKNIRQNFKKHVKPTVLDKNQQYLTRVANNNSLTSKIKYPILKTSFIN